MGAFSGLLRGEGDGEYGWCAECCGDKVSEVAAAGGGFFTGDATVFCCSGECLEGEIVCGPVSPWSCSAEMSEGSNNNTCRYCSKLFWSDS